MTALWRLAILISSRGCPVSLVQPVTARAITRVRAATPFLMFKPNPNAG